MKYIFASLTNVTDSFTALSHRRATFSVESKRKKRVTCMKRRIHHAKGMAKRKRRNQRRKIASRAPTTARQYFLLSAKQRETWDSIGHVISKIRDGMTLPKAAKEFGLDRNTVIRLGRSALRKQKNGRYVAKKTDQLLRVVNVLTTQGRIEVATRDSRQASLVGGHWAAVQKYLQTGDDSALLRFKGKKATDARGKRYVLLTDLKELKRMASAGVLSFESIYAGGIP